MSSLNNLSAESWVRRLNWLAGIMVGLSIAGFGIATFLTKEYLQGTIPPCSMTEGCGVVLGSKYAQIGMVPTAGIGMFYYLVLIVLGVAYFDSGWSAWLRLAGWVTAMGAMVSVYLVYLQLFVIKAICPYCMSSAVVSFLLFGIELVIWRYFLTGLTHRKKLDHQPEQLV